MEQARNMRNAQAVPRTDLGDMLGRDLSPALSITQQVRPKMTTLEEDQLMAGLESNLRTLLFPDCDDLQSPGSISLEPLEIDFCSLSPTTPVKEPPSPQRRSLVLPSKPNQQ